MADSSKEDTKSVIRVFVASLVMGLLLILILILSFVWLFN